MISESESQSCISFKLSPTGTSVAGIEALSKTDVEGWY
jgi:hypothetical protein